MHILNLSLSVSDDAIILLTNTIMIRGRLKAEKIPPVVSMSLLQAMQYKFYYSFPAAIEKTLGRQAIGNEHFRATIGNRAVNGNVASSSYVLPNDPTLLLDFLSTLDYFAENRNFDYVQMVDGSFENHLKREGHDFQLSIPFQQYVTRGKVVDDTNSLSLTLVETLLALPEIPAVYAPIIAALNQIHQKYLTAPSIPFVNYLDQPSTLLMGLGIPSTEALANPSSAVSEKMQALYSIERTLLSASKKQALVNFIDGLMSRKKIALYAPIKGQVYPFDDNQHYSYTFTEWYVLKNAKFCIKPDGRVSILLKNNSGYQEHYAKGRSNHDIMEKEFRYIASAIGLEFDHDTQFHSELIFTPACSQRLIAAGFHYDREYLRNLLKTKNFAAQFALGLPATTDTKLPRANFYAFPKEVLNIILRIAYAATHQGLHPNDVKETNSITWASIPSRMSFFTPHLKPIAEEPKQIEKKARSASP